MENNQENINQESNLLSPKELKNIIEAILFTQGKDMEAKEIARVLKDGLTRQYGEEEIDVDFISKNNIENTLNELMLEYHNNETNDKGIELVQTALGYRFQAKVEYKDFLQCLELEKPPKYSKAVLETLSIIAYRQPITRAEIEVIRGVAVSSEVIKKLLDREWIHVIGHKEVPGRPAVYATTKLFLADLGLKRLEDLPVFKLPEEEQKVENLENNIDDKTQIVLKAKQELEIEPDDKENLNLELKLEPEVV